MASLKLCTDELLLALAPPGQIVSVTYLAQQPLETPLWRQARRYRVNDGTLLSVAGMAPNLVVDMGGGGRDAARIAAKLGIHLLVLPYPDSLAGLESSIRTLAAALGVAVEGERMVRSIEDLRHTAPPARIDAIWLGGGGRSFAASGLGAEWMALAGLKQRALQGDRLTLEELLVRPPMLLLRSNYRSGQYSRDQQWLSNPRVRRAGKVRTTMTDGRLWTCMGPGMVNEIRRLRMVVRP